MNESGLTRMFGCLIVVVVLLFGVGVFLTTGVADRRKQSQERRFAQEEHAVKMEALREQTALGLQRERQLSPVKTAATGMGLMASAFTVMGLGFYLVAEARKRSRLIWPDKAGMFPQVIVELPNGAKAFHDPNRSPTHVTVYEPMQGGGVRIAPVVLPGLTDSVRQAAAVQLTRAAVHGGRPLTEEARDVARRLLPPGAKKEDGESERAQVSSGE
jgi:hypothetical protein